jgi:oligopeptidase A
MMLPNFVKINESSIITVGDEIDNALVMEDTIDFINNVESSVKKFYEFCEYFENMCDLNPNLVDDKEKIKEKITETEQYIQNKLMNHAKKLYTTEKNQSLRRILISLFPNLNVTVTDQEKYDFYEKELDALSSKYMQNVIESMKMYKLKTDSKEFSLFDYSTFITECEDSNLRKEMYMASVTRASNHFKKYCKEAENIDLSNECVVEQILHIRHEQSKLMGFNNYAERKLQHSTAKSTEEVFDMLDKQIEILRPKAREEIEILKKHYGVDSVNIWDVYYYIKKYNIKSDTYLFEEGLNLVITRIEQMFNLKFKQVTLDPINKWDEKVICYHVLDYDTLNESYLYIDAYTRPGKKIGGWTTKFDWHTKNSMAVGCIVTNFTENSPVSLKTLYHEFGHALQHILSTQNFRSISGYTGIEWDSIEIVSQAMERMHGNELWALEKLRTLYFAYFDYLLHTNKMGVKEAYNYCNKNIAVIKNVEENSEINFITHLFQSKHAEYAAGYYSYVWSDVLSLKCYDKLKTDPIKFKEIVLYMGGLHNPSDIVNRLTN